MTENDLINDVISSLISAFTSEQLEIIKSIFIVKMQNYDYLIDDMKEIEQTALAMVG